MEEEQVDLNDVVKNEILRLSKINTLLEKAFLKLEVTYREPELITQNDELIIKLLGIINDKIF